VTKCTCWIVAILLAILPFSVAWGQAGVRIGASFGYGAYSLDDINDFIDGTGEYWRDAEHELEAEEIDVGFSSEELGGGLVISGTVEYAVTDQISVGLELVPLSTSGEFSWDFEEVMAGGEGSIGAGERCDIEARATLVSLYGVYRVPVGNTGASLRLGGGAGLLFGALESDHRGFLEVTDAAGAAGREREDWTENLEATGSGMAFHALVGIEYPIAPQVVLTGDVAYRFASIAELEVDSVSTNDELDLGGIYYETEEGKVLKWSDYDGDFGFDDWAPRFRTDRGRDVELDFGGLYLTFGIAYVF
jgi:hypothetical protein